MPKTYTVDKDYHNSRFDKWFKNNVKDLPQSLIDEEVKVLGQGQTEDELKKNKNNLERMHLKELN